jgi:hypothetical protein
MPVLSDSVIEMLNNEHANIRTANGEIGGRNEGGGESMKER